jgi:GntR family transcriptional regulator / MocR family aminotransferase
MARQDQLDLLLGLDPAGRAPLRVQLEAQLRSAVRDRRLRPGTRLPSTRALARELGVSRGVVVEAYAQLAAEGYLVARAGSATAVAEVAAPAQRRPPAPAHVPSGRWDFSVGQPDLATFPRQAWLAATRRALGTAPDAALGYRDSRGAPELRSALAAYLGRSRGVVADPDLMVVCSGATQGIALLARVLAARGVQRIAMEDPGFPIHREVVRRQGVEPVPLPVDADGVRLDALAALDAGAVVVTPAHQLPTGAVLAPERRNALLAWAEEHDALIVEDDYDGEFRYDRTPVGALQGLGAERVAYLGTASKHLAPGLRLGWLVLPSWLVQDVMDEKGFTDAGTAVLEQLALADLLDSGALDRHVRRARDVYRRRRDVLVAALADRLPELELEGAAAGMHAVARLPDGGDDAALAAAAHARGVQLFPLSWMRFPGSTGPPALLFGYARIAEAGIPRGVAELAEAYAEVMALSVAR